MKLLIETDTNNIIYPLPDTYVEDGVDIYTDETKTQKIITGRNLDTTSIVDVKSKSGDEEAVKRNCGIYNGKVLTIDKKRYKEVLEKDIELLDSIKNGITDENINVYKQSRKDTKESIKARVEEDKVKVIRLLESIK